jgi:hypothetical protein
MNVHVFACAHVCILVRVYEFVTLVKVPLIIQMVRTCWLSHAGRGNEQEKSEEVWQRRRSSASALKLTPAVLLLCIFLRRSKSLNVIKVLMLSLSEF